MMVKPKIPKLRWPLLLIAAALAWHWYAHREAAVPLPVTPVEAVAEPEPSPMPAPKKAPHRRKPRRRREAIVVETPTPDGVDLVPSPTAVVTPAPRRSPQPRQASGVLESVAFKNEEEVLSNLGEPDEKFEHEDRVSWYYSKPARSRQGKPVCPELQFIDEEVRMVIMWPPDKMKEKIATARRLKAEGAAATAAPQTFTFLDSFKYLGVGTPQDTVLDDLGEPDSKRMVDSREEWNYDTLIVENGTSRRLTVLFQKGKVVEVLGR